MVKDVFAGYLVRLGVVTRPAPSSDTLAELMARHMQTVPFENLDIMAGISRRLSTETALEKIVEHGGFCYELNEAFRALLEHLKFTVRRIEARVWQPAAQRFGTPFDRLGPVRDGHLCLSSKSQPLYEMTLAEQPLEAFDPMCQYHQSSPESIFSKGLICTRATETGRITLSRDRLIIFEGGRRMETLATNVLGLLKDQFGISVERAALSRFA